jgi:hypothetical protein
VVRVLYPDVTPAEAAEVVVAHYQEQPGADGRGGALQTS